ncbi:MAG: hypothetical protein OHK0046_02600 [Anaerolineae bacterium]
MVKFGQQLVLHANLQVFVAAVGAGFAGTFYGFTTAQGRHTGFFVGVIPAATATTAAATTTAFVVSAATTFFDAAQ